MAAGGLLVTLWPITLATRVRFPVGSVRRKSVRVSEVIFHLSPATPSQIRGYTKGTGGDGRIICVCIVSCDQAQQRADGSPALDKQINYTSSSIHSTHAYTSGGRAKQGDMYSAPKNSRDYEAFSLKGDDLAIILECGCWSMSPSHK